MRIYFLGIAGTAMGNAALLLRDLGHEVIGSDQAVYPPMSDMLLQAGVEVLEGYSVDRLQEIEPDLVVIGNAFSRGNEEIEFLLESRSIPFVSLPGVLNQFVLSKRQNIIVTGTHGKTTTTSLTAYLLEQSGANPGYLIGGAPLDPDRGWNNGSADAPFVIEGDEYDSAFFDKRSKFIHYAPHIVILNNLEFDHADIFRDLEDVKRSFDHLIRLIPRSGFLLINEDDSNVLSLLPINWTRVIRVGVSESCELRITKYETNSKGSKFDLEWKNRRWLSVEWAMLGLFNARNAAMACLASALSILGEDRVSDFQASGIEQFRGVQRRQQIRLETDRLIAIEDFAHHPTAIKEILESVRARHPNSRLIAAFEPRSNTSRLEIMRAPLCEALSQADTVVIGAAKKSPDKYNEIMNTEVLASDLNAAGIAAIANLSNEASLKALIELCADDSGQQLVVFLTNGSFDGIIGQFVDHCLRGNF